MDSGAIPALVGMLPAFQQRMVGAVARDAAAEAIAALCSYCQEGKVAYLEAMVHALQSIPQQQAGPVGLAARRRGREGQVPCMLTASSMSGACALALLIF